MNERCPQEGEHYLMDSCSCGYIADGIITDDFGSNWVKCGPECDLQVVRPGKSQCSCDGEKTPACPCSECNIDWDDPSEDDYYDTSHGACMCDECDRSADYENERNFMGNASRVYDEALAVLLSKHQDYGPRNISDSPGGPLNGLRVRMHDKLARINNLLDTGAGENHESIEDSFLDLLNYSAIGLLVLKGEWPS